MITLRTLLIILALVCFLLAALGWPPVRGNLVAGGLFLWLLSELVK